MKILIEPVVVHREFVEHRNKEYMREELDNGDIHWAKLDWLFFKYYAVSKSTNELLESEYQKLIK